MGKEALMPNESNIAQMRVMFDGMLSSGAMSEQDDLQETLQKEDDGMTTTQIV